MTQNSHLAITPLSLFNYEFTATSHGRVDLAPVAWNKECQAVQRVERLSGGKVVLHLPAQPAFQRRVRIRDDLPNVGSGQPAEGSRPVRRAASGARQASGATLHFVQGKLSVAMAETKIIAQMSSLY